MAKEAEMRRHRCCFIGHKPEKLHVSEESAKAWLSQQIDQAIQDGFVTFISGMAMGIDIWAGQLVLEKKASHPGIHLIAVTPYPTFSWRWSEEWKQAYTALWEAADHRVTICKGFQQEAFDLRNKWLVDHSSRIIAFFNGSSGGAFNTLEYAVSEGLEHIEYETERQRENKLVLPYPQNLLMRIDLQGQPPEDIEDRLEAFFQIRDERQADMLRSYFVGHQTLQSIGDRYELSRERVRQLIEKNLRLLRHAGRRAFLLGSNDPVPGAQHVLVESLYRLKGLPIPSEAPKKKFYAVAVGVTPGVYETWAECEAQTKGFTGCRFKAFPTREEAERFIQNEQG